MQSVALHDLLEAEPATSTTLEIAGLSVPQAADNIVLKAHAAMEHAVGRKLPTHFRLHKRIPPGAGLGGASTDAAAALRALKIVHVLDTDITKIAHGVGADVPFFIAGGSALAEGTGDRLSPLPTQHAWYAIAWPRIELSTATVYGAWDEVKGEPPNELRKAAERADLRLRDFAESLGGEWQMTGSGSAFFKRCASEEAALKAIATLDCWTAVTYSVGPWA